jgi:excisionase family DNA binding protein
MKKDSSIPPDPPDPEEEGNNSSEFENEQLAANVAKIILRQLSINEILRLSQFIFFTVDEAAEILRVQPKTISTWISQRRIPVRYAGGRPRFILEELLDWTLPENDSHKSNRLSTAKAVKIVMNRLTANRERKNPDGSL